MNNSVDTKVVKVKLASEIVLNDKNNDSDIIVTIGEKNYKARVHQTYKAFAKPGPYEVQVDGFSPEQLSALCVVLDTEEIVLAHSELVKKREAERKARADAEASAYYKHWEAIAKTLGFSMHYSLEEYLKLDSWNKRVSMSQGHTYLSNQFKVTITTGREWIEVSTGYDRDQNRRTKKSKKLPELVSSLISREKYKIDCKVEADKSRETSLSKAQKALGEDVTTGEYYSHRRKVYQSISCLELSVGEGFDAPKIKFNTFGDGTYQIHSLAGVYNAEEMAKILDVVRNAKVRVKK